MVCNAPQLLKVLDQLSVAYYPFVLSKPMEARLNQEHFFSQWWRSGESTLLPPMWPGFDYQTRRHMWVEIVGSLL